MSKIRQGKLRLLQGVSTVLAMSVATVAQAQSVEVEVGVENTDGVLATTQDNSVNVTANAQNNTVPTDVNDLTNSSVAGGGGTTGSAALGNLDTITFSDAGAAQMGTSVALVADQSNSGDITANTIGTDVGVTTGSLQGSTATLNGSTDTSSATANQASQTLTLSATDLTLGTTSASVDTEAASTNIEISAAAIVTSNQDNTGAIVTANTTGSQATMDTLGVTDSSVTVNGNTMTATATGSSAANTANLAGTELGIGGAVVSSQTNDSTSGVAANAEGVNSIISDGSVDNSSLSVSNDRLMSQATGVTASNTLTATATNVTLAAGDTTAGAVVDGGEGILSAGYAVLSEQVVDGTTTADTTTTGSAFKINVDGTVSESTLANDTNTASAKAQGAVSSNSVTLSVAATLDTASPSTGLANGVAVTNIQSLGVDADVTATVDTSGANLVQSTVDGDLTNSSLSSSGNKVTSTAEGANATNILSASATNLLAAGLATAAPSVLLTSTGIATADAAFTVLNTQSAGANDVSATTGDNATVNIAIDDTGATGDIANSTVSGNLNTFTAFATSNKAANGLSLSGTVVEGSAGLLNTQTSSSAVSSSVGTFTAGVPDVIDRAGVTITNTGTIDASTLSVNGNIAQGSAVANSSVNQLSASATTLDGDGDAGYAFAGTTATADFALLNNQSTDGSSTTDIYTTYGIAQDDGNTLSSSKLTVSNNTQFGEALGNTSTNRLTLNATDAGAGITPTAALSNVQDGDAVNIDSTSDMNLYVSAASTGSAIAISGNSNTSLGVVNNGSNALSVTGTNLTGDTAQAYSVPGSATGDYALNSWQDASGTLDSTANTTAYNFDEAVGANSGTSNSSIAFNTNVTTAEASANRVANALTVNASAGVDASAGLSNTQLSSTTVNATALSDVGYTMTDATGYAADSSTVSIDGNATNALARGNTANNALTYTAGATYGGLSVTTIDPTAAGSVTATAAVLNSQSNSGAITATADAATGYALAVDGTVGTGAALNSSLSVANNTTSAGAYGNSAVNSLTMATFASGIPSAGLSNSQYNSGAVVATATSVTYSLDVTGAASGSAIRNTGNVVTAQAVGNSSVSSITGGN